MLLFFLFIFSFFCFEGFISERKEGQCEFLLSLFLSVFELFLRSSFIFCRPSRTSQMHEQICYSNAQARRSSLSLSFCTQLRGTNSVSLCFIFFFAFFFTLHFSASCEKKRRDFLSYFGVCILYYICMQRIERCYFLSFDATSCLAEKLCIRILANVVFPIHTLQRPNNLFFQLHWKYALQLHFYAATFFYFFVLC